MFYYFYSLISFFIVKPWPKIVNRTTAYVKNRIKDLPSPIESGKFKAKATLNPPLKPPQVIIKAVFFSKDFLIERSKIGSFTPINLDKTQINII